MDGAKRDARAPDNERPACHPFSQILSHRQESALRQTADRAGVRLRAQNGTGQESVMPYKWNRNDGQTRGYGRAMHAEMPSLREAR
jgi:hypothetical protein